MYEGKVILVAGGTGAVGEGIVKYLAENALPFWCPLALKTRRLTRWGMLTNHTGRMSFTYLAIFRMKQMHKRCTM